MNKYKLFGTLTALVLLISSLILKYVFPDSDTAVLALPFLALGAWVLAVFDTLAYKKSEFNAIQKKTELTRLIALYIVSILISVGTVIFMISTKQ